MKATRAHLLGEFTGKLDGLIYYRRNNNGRLYVRRQFRFKNHPCHAEFGSAQKAIHAIQPSAAYKQDLIEYMHAYNKLPENRLQSNQSWVNIYNKLMYAMQKAMPDKVDLRIISRAQIAEQNLPCNTVKAAVEAGLIPQVKGHERLTHNI